MLFERGQEADSDAEAEDLEAYKELYKQELERAKSQERDFQSAKLDMKLREGLYVEPNAKRRKTAGEDDDGDDIKDGASKEKKKVGEESLLGDLGAAKKDYRKGNSRPAERPSKFSAHIKVVRKGVEAAAKKKGVFSDEEDSDDSEEECFQSVKRLEQKEQNVIDGKYVVHPKQNDNAKKGVSGASSSSSAAGPLASASSSLGAGKKGAVVSAAPSANLMAGFRDSSDSE
jgi:hypothetical protein